MKRSHEMPFGAECHEDGTVRFRLWAPKVSSVSLILDESPDRQFTMVPIDEGWFELVTDQGRAGTRYQFRVDQQHAVPDPASRYQPAGVHGPSEVIDPTSLEWSDGNWRGRPWNEAIIYELHVGAFTPEGTIAAAEKKLDYLATLGATAVEIMPLSSFPGGRNWGYDGVLPYAPAAAYGRPDDLKRFIYTAHSKKLMVFLDVVYNHFGPEGNYLPLYAPQFFSDRHKTPWGDAINFDGPCSRTVRDFFIHNALYWLEEYHFDGLRFDAVHAIPDESRPDMLSELAVRIRKHFRDERHIHLVLENDSNSAHYLARENDDEPSLYQAQWNDDIHHALHVLITGEKDGYYADYADHPAWHFGRCLAEGFSYQGELSRYRGGRSRGEPTSELPASCFVSFLQNHDQVGNRALGERIVQLAQPAAVKAALTCLLLAPSPPLLFMGEEFGAKTPFFFFCDFGASLASRVTEGRRGEFAGFAEFSSPEAQARIPDPNSEKTFLVSKLDWASREENQHREYLQVYRELLRFRGSEIVPRIAKIATGQAKFELPGEKAVFVRWPFKGSGGLTLVANFCSSEICIPGELRGRLLYSTPAGGLQHWGKMAPFSAAWLLDE
jgi:maltooligosyltrehalose trehalohydrolase